jgi:hypothetical protein
VSSPQLIATLFRQQVNSGSGSSSGSRAAFSQHCRSLLDSTLEPIRQTPSSLGQSRQGLSLPTRLPLSLASAVLDRPCGFAHLHHGFLGPRRRPCKGGNKGLQLALVGAQSTQARMHQNAPSDGQEQKKDEQKLQGQVNHRF